MAKIRIYELARDLNMKNKALLDKLSEMGIQVASHMSSIEEETASKVKGQIFGKKVDVVEETRVKPTVIRRRKKVVKQKPPIPEAVVEEKDEKPVVEMASAPPPATEETEEPSPKEAKDQKAPARGPVLKIVKPPETPEPTAPSEDQEAQPVSEKPETPAPSEEIKPEAPPRRGGGRGAKGCCRHRGERGSGATG